MKLCTFSITALLASFVAANPILAPRAPSRPFQLQGYVGTDSNRRLLAILPVAEPGYRGYFRFGWYGKGSEKIELYFTQDEYQPGPVFDVRQIDGRQNGYEMVLQKLTDGNTGSTYYTALLIDRANTALSGLQSPSRFYNNGFNFYSSPESSDGSGSPNDPNGIRWMTCIRSGTIDATSPDFVEDLIFSRFLPSDCRIGRSRVRLAVDYVSSTAVQV